MTRELIHPCPHAEDHPLLESCLCGYKAPNREGCWIAYYHDGSGSVVFRTELEALRHALSYSMAVRFARFGDPDWMRGER